MAKPHTLSLLKQRRFLPYFITQFLGAFNDNIFKNVLLILVAFAASGTLPISSNLFINLAAGLFILPFFLFSATAGELADKYDKDWFIRKVKLAEIIIMSVGAVGFITQNYSLLLLLLFLMGTQSAFFGPVKYALLPQQLNKNELVPGNALVETGTFLAILLGTICAGLIASGENAHYIAAFAVVAFSIIGYIASRFIPHSLAANPSAKLRWSPFKQTKSTLRIAKNDSVIYKTILAISWFWFMGACYLTQFPNFTKIILNGSESSVSFLLALFSIGIAFGSLMCDKLSKHKIELGIVPFASLGISLFGALMVLTIPESLPVFDDFLGFVSYFPLWPTFACLLLTGASGGVFIVPLYSLLQSRAKKEERAQIIAANNIFNALFMVGSAILAIVSLSILELTIPQLFMLLALLNLFVFAYSLNQVFIYVVRFGCWVLTHTIYRVNHKNLHYLPQEGPAIVVCNHVSYMDALLLSAVYPRLVRFMMQKEYADLPFINGFFKRVDVISISATDRSSIKNAFVEVDKTISNGGVVCIFPEGELTNDGEVREFMRGIDIILKRSSVPVIPVALKGLWGSYFSRFKGRACKGIPQRFWSKLEVEVGKPIEAKMANSALIREKIITLRGDYR